MLRVRSLHLYPIKSCAGISVKETRVGPTGLANDRRFMVVDRKGRFVTGRTHPHLAKVTTSIENGCLRAQVAGLGHFETPLDPSNADLASLDVQVWSDTVRGFVVPEAGDLFARLLEQPGARLVRFDDRLRRNVPQMKNASGDHTRFADAYPALLLGQASLDDLSKRVGSPMDLRRFRPNIVFEGGAAYAEDFMAELRIGKVTFRGPKRCDRCVMTTRDPDSLEGGPEPLRTLASYRRSPEGVFFGMNVIPENEGILTTNDRLEVLRTAAPAP